MKVQSPRLLGYQSMFLQLDGNGALYAQLARSLKRAILQGS